MKKNKNHNPPLAFEPGEGMKFKLNDRKFNRIAQLVKPLDDGRRWEAHSLTSNRGVFRIRTVDLHKYPCGKGWSLLSPADALPETFGQIELKGSF